MAAWVLLGLGVVAAIAAANALRPSRAVLLILPSWLSAMIVVELAAHLVVMNVVLGAVLIALGALDDTIGVVGLVLLTVATLAHLPHLLASVRTTVDVDGRPEELDLAADAPPFPWSHVVFPLLALWRRGVRHERGRVFAEVDGKRLRLDVYRPKQADGPRPAVIYVHGGGWFFGSRHEQGIPLLNHLAANGFVGFNVDYRLSPQATMPDHLEDVLRAIDWVRDNAEELGVDPTFIAIAGGSAGGHLTALAALTGGHVQAAVPFYGIYDLLDLHDRHLPAFDNLIEWVVMKARRDREPERYRAASPLHQVHAGAPPFFVVHGDADTLIPVEESRAFVKALRAVSDAPVMYAEMKGAQHAFDVLPTVRTVRIIRAIERFLTLTYEHRSTSEIERELTAA